MVVIKQVGIKLLFFDWSLACCSLKTMEQGYQNQKYFEPREGNWVNLADSSNPNKVTVRNDRHLCVGFFKHPLAPNLPYHRRSGLSARLPSLASGFSSPTSRFLGGSPSSTRPPPLSVRDANSRPPKIDLSPLLRYGSIAAEVQPVDSVSQPGVKKVRG